MSLKRPPSSEYEDFESLLSAYVNTRTDNSNPDSHTSMASANDAKIPRCVYGTRCRYLKAGSCKFDHTRDDIISCNVCGQEGHYSTTCSKAVCHRCGMRGHTSPYCPEATCYKCGIRGHTSPYCPHSGRANTCDPRLKKRRMY